MRYSRWPAFLCAAILAGCGGTSPAALPGAPAPGAHAQALKAFFRIKVPKAKARARRPGYVSPSTKSITIDIAGPVAVKETVALTPSSPGCSPALNGTTCTIAFSLRPGNYAASIVAYDNVVPASGKALSAAASVPFVVATGVKNSVDLTLSGIPFSIGILTASSLSEANPQGGIDLFGTVARPLYAQAYDADGAAIVGPGAPSFTVAQSGSLVLTVGQPTAAAPNTFTLQPPATYTSSTAQLTVTAVYPAGLTNGCVATGAVCTAKVAVDMQELLAAAVNGTVSIYQAGHTTPLTTLTYLVDFPQGIAFDPSGDLFVANCYTGCSNGTSADDVVEYAPPYTGLPVVITSGVNVPQALGTNAAGDLFVANCPMCATGGTDSVSEFAPPFTTASSPLATITNGIAAPQAMAFDSSGDLFVADCPASCAQPFSGNDDVTAYGASSYTGTPITIGASTLSEPSSLALDSLGNLFVADTGNNNVVEFFKAQSYSNLSALTISTSVNGPASVTLDAGNDLFVGNGNGTHQILEFLGPTYGAAPTVLTSHINNTPTALVVDGLGDLYAALASGRLDFYTTPYGTAKILSGEANQLAVLP